MTEIEEIVEVIKAQEKERLTKSTYESRRCYLNQLLNTARRLEISVPCQELYDVFAADDYGSKERRFHLDHCIKLVDEYAGTCALRTNGKLYNEPVLPSREEALTALEGVSYPAISLDIGLLVVKAGWAVEHLGLTQSTIGQYKNAWMDVLRYFFISGTTSYSKHVIQAFIDEETFLYESGQVKEWKWKIRRKAAHVLVEVAETGQFVWAHIHKGVRCHDERIEEVRCRYLTLLKERNLQQSTIGLYDYVFRNALEHAGINAFDELMSLSVDDVQTMVRGFSSVSSQSSLSTLLPILRKTLEFLYQEGFGEFQMSGLVMRPFYQKGNVAAYITRQDEGKLIEQLEHESKRNKAIILLALRLGLRECDICNLALESIDWENDRICLVQEKTRKALALPLLPDVGNALMDYILEERPRRGDGYPYVFLRAQAPHIKLSGLYTTCSGLIKRAGIAPVNGTTTGTHLFRYTLVNRLLDAKVPHQVITDTLGHSSKESDKPYLSMEESMLRMCALDLSVIGKISWEEGWSNG